MGTIVNRARRVMRISPVEEKALAQQERGIFYLVGGVDETMAQYFSIMLSNVVKEGRLKNIWILMNCHGGNILDGLDLCDAIGAVINSGCAVNIVGKGVVASMAIDIMQCASRRLSWPHTQFCLHQASQTATAGSREVNKIIEDAEFLSRLNMIGLRMVAERIGMPVEELNAKSKKTDVWLTAQEALKFGRNGLIDEIITTFPF